MNQKSHLLQIFFFAIKNEFLLFKVNKQGKTNRLNDGRFPLILLLFKKQQIFHLPSPFNARNYLAFIAAERNVLLVNVPVPGFQFLYQLAFGKVFVT